MTASSAAAANRTGNAAWTPGRSNNMGRPLSPAGIRRRLMAELSTRIVHGDKAALEMFITLEKSGSAVD